jgi:hypothetical protein
MIRILAAAALLALLAAPSARAQSSDSAFVYSLASPSNFAWGCYGPCECPVSERPLTGTFRLRDLGFDGLFERYAVSDVRFSATANGNLHIAGTGTYRVGGEVAITQEMILDLSVNGGGVQHFDSGLVPGGGSFPKIDIAVSLHRQQACFDTVVDIVAGRIGTVGAEGTPPAGLVIRPNPFRSETRIELSLPAPARVELGIYDLAGRKVSGLTASMLDAGPHAFRWDGNREGGGPVPAGMYFVRMSAGSGHAVRALVKL